MKRAPKQILEVVGILIQMYLHQQHNIVRLWALVGLSQFKSQPHHPLAVQPWASHLNSLSLSFYKGLPLTVPAS